MKSVSELRELLVFPAKPVKSGIQGIVSKDQRKGWLLMQMSYLVNDWKY